MQKVTAEQDTGSDIEEKEKMINKTKDDKTEDAMSGANALTADAKKKKYIKWGIIGAIILIVVVLAIVLPITLTKKNNDNPITPPTPPAPPGPPIPDGDWNPYATDGGSLVTSAYGFSGIIKSSQDYNNLTISTPAMAKLFASQNDSNSTLGVKLNGLHIGTVNNKFVNQIKFSMNMVKWRVAHFVMTDNNNTRYSVPETAVPNPSDDQSMRLDMLGFSYTANPFTFSFTDPTDSDNLFVTTEGCSLVFVDKFIQMDFKLPSKRIYGFGERIREFNLTEGTWTMWAIGQNSPYDDGTGRLGVYGVHPFILVQGKKKGDFFGMYFRNSNAQSPVLTYTDTGSTLSYIALGGQIEIFFFMHGTAQDIIKQYQTYFGTPKLPPFWAMGWQQASYKWDTLEKVKNVSDSYAAYKFPLDVMYLDIPYMDNFVDFTVNTTAFPNLTVYTDSLHNNNQHLVVIIDAGISADNTSNPYYTMGNTDDIFIKSGKYLSKTYNNNLLLKVWPQKAVFVDWFNDKCMNVWGQGLFDLYNRTKFDGIWIDMNEPTGFKDGEVVPDDAQNKTTASEQSIKRQSRFLLKEDEHDYNWYASLAASGQNTYDLPFIPRLLNKDTGAIQNFDNWTLSLNATHGGLNNETEYNVHSLYGHMMASRTFQYLTLNTNASTNYPNTDKRPFILTRSTFTSSGKYASHWLGDNFRDWNYLRWSIAGIMNMQMFGVPHVGADVCGFFGAARDDELCTRWLQLATFYPFARLHYEKESDPNEPYLMAGKYFDMGKRAMHDRYSYLRHMYTCLFEASQNGGTCFDPLFYQFPLDDNLFQDYESSFMVGNVLKVTPILSQLADNETTTFSAYFPNGTWVDLNNASSIISGNGTYNLSATQSSVHVHLKAGGLFPYQENTNMDVLTVSGLVNKSISLYANRDENGYASGTVFLDKGETMSELKDKTYEYYQFNLQANSLQSSLADGQSGAQNHLFGELKIFNAADLQDLQFACYLDKSLNPVMMSITPHADQLAVSIAPEKPLKFSEFHSIHFGGQNDINVCAKNSFYYIIANQGTAPDLSNTNNVTIQLQHSMNILPNINFTMRLLQGEIVNMKWTWATDANGSMPSDKRTPREVPDDFITTTNMNLSTGVLGDYVKISYTIGQQPFTVMLYNKYNGQTTNFFTLNGMLFDEYLNWINVTVNTVDTNDNFKGVFGLGERANKDFFYKDGVYGMWARDSLTPDENGKQPGNNMYGTHPLYMFKHNEGAWVGVFTKLANAQDWWIKNDKTTGNINLQTVATGGVADIYIMKETTPDKVVSKYFTMAGNPVLVPQWALGWNQCRWGYTNITQLEDVVDGYANNSLPLDVQWSDIDYMDSYRSFTYDKVNFKGLPDFITNLHSKGMKYVPILDAGLAYRPGGNYDAFNDGVTKDVFMKINGEAFIGQVWPNDAAYPDFFATNTSDWYKSYLKKMYGDIQFDGLWEDMNEASNFCNGVCYQSQKPTTQVKTKLKYTPTGRDLETKSMALDTTHANGYLQLDTHSYYGTQMVKTTHEFFTENQMRTFIIERSSFAGMGKYSSRWLGDNNSQESHMAYSISGIMLMNMFGITLAGSDICGFIGDTWLELCTKWHIVGAFYPFSRNHNNWGQTSQEPWIFKGKQVGNGQDALDVMRDAIKTKYSLVRYYYTNLFTISTQGTGTFYKPMFFEFPSDNKAFSDIVSNVMLGSALKLSINAQNLTYLNYDYYFPLGWWCSVDGTQSLGECFYSQGATRNFPANVTDYQLHLRAGYIVPMQDTKNKTGKLTVPFSTTKDLQSWPIDLHILGSNITTTTWSATGTYVNDDGTSLDYQTKYNQYTFSAAFNSQNISVKMATDVRAQGQTSQITNCTEVNKNDFLQRIFIYNADNFLNNKTYSVNATILDDSTSIVGNATYSGDTKILTFEASEALCLSTLKELLFTVSA